MTRTLPAVGLEDIEAARSRISHSAIRTPVVPLHVDDAPATILLKLECLQPIGSFKLRGASNAMALASAHALRNGVYTASAGNMAQGVAWNARRLGISCHVVVPDYAPQAKLEAIKRLGAQIVPVPFEEWWQVLIDHEYPSLDGFFVHPVSDPAVIAGNGTIGLEILEDVPEADAIVVPFGGGGLSCGIASAIRGRGHDIPVYAAEVETAAPLAASLEAGAPQRIQHTASFVDGIGGGSVLAEMWPLASRLLAGSIVSSVAHIADALRLLVQRNHIVAEGAGAASIAAALSGRAGTGTVVCVVSGGNIDHSILCEILAGSTP